MNVSTNLPLFEEISNELLSLNMYVHASECHGAICGYLSANQGEDFNYWFKNVLHTLSDEALTEGEVSNVADSEDAQIINTMFNVSLQQLQDPSCSIRLLVPDDEEALSERVEALAEWCHGFLFGLTLVAADEMSKYSTDAQEVISDFVKISQTDLDGGDNAEEAEAAYAEIVEYVRIGALLIWADARKLHREDEAPVLH